MNIQYINVVRNYLDPTFLPTSKNKAPSFSYGWAGLTHLSEKASRIQNRAFRYIAKFFALGIDSTVGCGIVCSLVYNPCALLLNNTYVKVRNFFAKPKTEWNETALKTWGIILGVGIFHYLGGFSFLQSSPSPAASIEHGSSTFVSNDPLELFHFMGMSSVVSIFIMAYFSPDTTKEILLQKLINAQTRIEFVQLLHNNNYEILTSLNNGTFDIPGFSDREKEALLPQVNRFFGPNITLTNPVQ